MAQLGSTTVNGQLDTNALKVNGESGNLALCVSGNTQIHGNLEIDGDLTYINTSEIQVTDKTIEIAYVSGGIDDWSKVNGAGIQIGNRPATSTEGTHWASMTFVEEGGEKVFKFSHPISATASVARQVAHKIQFGSGIKATGSAGTDVTEWSGTEDVNIKVEVDASGYVTRTEWNTFTASVNPVVELVNASASSWNSASTWVTANSQSVLQSVAVIAASESKWNAVSASYVAVSASIGQANGIATLDANGKLTESQIPSSIIGGLKFGGDVSVATAGNVSATINTDLKDHLSETVYIIGLIESSLDEPTNHKYGFGGSLKNWYFVAKDAGSFAGHTFAIGDHLVAYGNKWVKLQQSSGVQRIQGSAEGSTSWHTGDVRFETEWLSVPSSITPGTNVTVVQRFDEIATQIDNATGSLMKKDASNSEVGTNGIKFVANSKSGNVKFTGDEFQFVF